jgi:hypothetical protein
VGKANKEVRLADGGWHDEGRRDAEETHIETDTEMDIRRHNLYSTEQLNGHHRSCHVQLLLRE